SHLAIYIFRCLSLTHTFSLFFNNPPSPTLSSPLSYTTLFRSAPLPRIVPPCAQTSSQRLPCPNAPALCLKHCDRESSDRVRNLRSEEHTSELQSRVDLVCRLLLDTNNNIKIHSSNYKIGSWVC